MKEIEINYSIFRKPLYILLVAFLGAIAYQLFAFFGPDSILRHLREASPMQFIFFFIINFILIESITVFIVFRLIVLYARLLSLGKLNISSVSLIAYELKFLPVFLCSYFFFAPITGTVRFLYQKFILQRNASYAGEAYYSLNNYIQYIGPVLGIGYLVLNINLLIEFIKYSKKRAAQPLVTNSSVNFTERIVGELQGKKIPLPVNDIVWIGVEDRVYFACDKANKYRLNKTITEIEKMLDPANFLRVRRDVIINLNYIESYAPWFNGKYVVKMKHKDKVEFEISPERAKSLIERVNS